MRTVEEILQEVNQMVEEIGDIMFAEYLDPADYILDQE